MTWTRNRARWSRRVIILGLAGSALVLVGCAGNRITPPTPSPVKPAINPFQAKVTGRSYTLKLVKSPGAQLSSAPSVSITISAANDQVCWQFSRLHVRGSLFAFIHRGGVGVSGPVVVELGRRFATSGCVSDVPPALLTAMEAHPNRYYVGIDSRVKPLGALRAQL